MKHIAVIAAGIALVACGPIQRAQIQAQQAAVQAQQQQWREQTLAFTAQEQQECDDSTRIADFDPIRDKIELCKIGLDRVKTTAFQFLSIDTNPEPAEKPAIAKWGALRDALNARARARLAAQPLPGVAPDVWNRMTLFTTNMMELSNELAAALYEGKLSYGEFAKRRQGVITDTLTAIQDYTDALKAADYQRRMQAAALAEQHYANQVQATETYLKMLGVGAQIMQGGAAAPGSRIYCTTNPMASGTMPNPTLCQGL